MVFRNLNRLGKRVVGFTVQKVEFIFIERVVFNNVNNDNNTASRRLKFLNGLLY